LVAVTINGVTTQAPDGISLFDCADGIGIRVPTSCRKQGKCKECIVEVAEGNVYQFESPPPPPQAWLVKKRAEKVDEIRHYVSVARGQLDLISNSFQLIADQIVTMQSPQELSGQLDELLDGVEAIQETTRDTEKILNSVGEV